MTPDRMAAIHQAAFVQDRPWSATEFRALLATPGTSVTSRENGFALWRAVAGEVELLTIAVAPEKHRQGLGRVLMADWMSQAESLGSTAFLEVAADNLPAIALYHSHSFSTVGRRPAYYTHREPAVDALVMQACLPMASASP